MAEYLRFFMLKWVVARLAGDQKCLQFNINLTLSASTYMV